MTSPNRSKLCKLQNKSKGNDVYLLYTDRIGKKMKTPSNRRIRKDFAGVFDNKNDAQQVADCLTNIFSKLHDDEWELKYPYHVYEYRVDNTTPKYSVLGTYQSRNDLKTYRVQHVQYIVSTLQNAKKIVQDNAIFKYKIAKYRMNDILPTMWLEDYDKTLHTRKFKHVMNELKDFPQAQQSRQNLRRSVREVPGLLYSDSSDSEDESNYTRFKPNSALGMKTNRSLLHTPPKKYTKKLKHGVKKLI